jgi:hypothetical protein
VSFLLHWLNNNAPAITAIATIAYTVISILLWRSTRRQAIIAARQAELTGLSIKAAQEEMALRYSPQITVGVVFRFFKGTDDYLRLSLECVVQNLGLEIAYGTEVDLTDELKIFHEIVRFGDVNATQVVRWNETVVLTPNVWASWAHPAYERGELQFLVEWRFKDKKDQVVTKQSKPRVTLTQDIRDLFWTKYSGTPKL